MKKSKTEIKYNNFVDISSESPDGKKFKYTDKYYKKKKGL